MEPGTKVEVRSSFDRSWSRGFEIAEVVEGGEDAEEGVAYTVRRRSDGRVLPRAFHEDDLREERRGRSMWWY